MESGVTLILKKKSSWQGRTLSHHILKVNPLARSLKIILWGT